MQDLRLVGVHEDGEHLLLSAAAGEIHRLRIDEALRVAVSRTPKRPSTTPTVASTAPQGPPMSPRDIQARIRSGATAEEVSEESGIDLARIRRYEGPVLAERHYTTEQARRVEVSDVIAGHDGYRSAFGDDAATLGDMVEHRLRSFDVDLESLDWDAWRRPDGSWTVVATFTPSESCDDVGEEPVAKWTFNPTRKSVQNANRWAQLLGEIEPMDGPLPARRLAAVQDRVFDFEALEHEGDEPLSSSQEPDPSAESSTAAAPTDLGSGGEDTPDDVPSPDSDSEELLDVLRARRGQRLGVDEDGDDALALLLSRGSIPAAHPRTGAGEDVGDHHPDDSTPRPSPVLSVAPQPRGNDGEPDTTDTAEAADTTDIGSASRDDPAAANNAAAAGPTDSKTADADEVVAKTADTDETARAEMAGAETARDEGSDRDPAEDRGTPRGKSDPDPEGSETGRKQAKQKRSSVPSWDEIMFGTRGN